MVWPRLLPRDPRLSQPNLCIQQSLYVLLPWKLSYAALSRPLDLTEVLCLSCKIWHHCMQAETWGDGLLPYPPNPTVARSSTAQMRSG